MILTNISLDGQKFALLGVTSRNGKNRTLRPSKDNSSLKKRSRIRLQRVLCDDWTRETPAALLRRI
jgi:hypothetical protein